MDNKTLGFHERKIFSSFTIQAQREACMQKNASEILWHSRDGHLAFYEMCLETQLHTVLDSNPIEGKNSGRFFSIYPSLADTIIVKEMEFLELHKGLL